jgi:hypothetical protein
MVIRVLAVPDYLDLSSFDEIFRILLGWDGLGFSFHIHGQEFTSFLGGRGRSGKPCGIFNCGHERHSSTRAEGSIFGNGNSGFSTRKREVVAMARRCAWRAEARLRPRAAAAPRVIA